MAGIDEAGRGALAGPVVAAAVMLKPGRPYPYRDSKLLKAEEREALAREVLATAVAVGVGVASAREVDSLNVLNATHLAARRAIAAMVVAPDALVTDYLRIRSGLPELAVAKGESKSYQIAAASIVAKSARDALMLELDGRYPGYGFARHKGYGVKQHLRAIEELGATAQHRTSFAPVAARSSRALFPLGMRP